MDQANINSIACVPSGIRMLYVGSREYFWYLAIHSKIVGYNLPVSNKFDDPNGSLIPLPAFLCMITKVGAVQQESLA